MRERPEPLGGLTLWGGVVVVGLLSGLVACWPDDGTAGRQPVSGTMAYESHVAFGHRSGHSGAALRSDDRRAPIPVGGDAGVAAPSCLEVASVTRGGVPAPGALFVARYDGYPNEIGPVVAEQRSDAEGRAELCGVGLLDRRVFVDAFDEEGRRGRAVFDQWEAARLAGSGPLVVPLYEGATITGRVLTPTGLPIEGAVVWATDHGAYHISETPPREEQLDPMAEPPARTDAQGRFTQHVRPGLHSLHVDSPRAMAGVVVAPVIARAGEISEVDVVARAAATLRGRVVDAAGSPVVGASVHPHVPSRLGRSEETDAEGRFEIRRLDAEATYDLTVSHAAFAPLELRGLAPSDEPTLTLREGASVRVTIRSDLPPACAAEAAVDVTPEAGPARGAVVVDGVAELERLPPGRAVVSVYAGDLSASSEVVLRSGQHLEVDLPLTRSSERGLVVLDLAGPERDEMVSFTLFEATSLMLRGGAPLPGCLSLEPGTYELSAQRGIDVGALQLDVRAGEIQRRQVALQPAPEGTADGLIDEDDERYCPMPFGTVQVGDEVWVARADSAADALQPGDRILTLGDEAVTGPLPADAPSGVASIGLTVERDGRVLVLEVPIRCAD